MRRFRPGIPHLDSHGCPFLGARWTQVWSDVMQDSGTSLSHLIELTITDYSL